MPNEAFSSSQVHVMPPPSLHASRLLLPHQQRGQHACAAKRRQDLHLPVVAAREDTADEALHVRRQCLDGFYGFQYAVELVRGEKILRLGLDFVVQHIGAGCQANASA